jgi:predicted MFS family arabinose efflux permease
VVLPLGVLAPGYAAAMALWAVIGAGASLIMTPSGLLLRRSAHPEDRPALFAAQFALSHACWLVAYPAAGWLGPLIGLPNTFVVLAAGAALGAIAAALLWPADDPEVIEHEHEGLTHAHGHADDPHHADGLAEWRPDGAHSHRPVRHAHAFVIDDHHPVWPGGNR